VKRQWRIWLGLAGALLVIIALLLLAYALWPLPVENLQATLAPGALTPPVAPP
jgi:hypothetical protein